MIAPKTLRLCVRRDVRAVNPYRQSFPSDIAVFFLVLLLNHLTKVFIFFLLFIRTTQNIVKYVSYDPSRPFLDLIDYYYYYYYYYASILDLV